MMGPSATASEASERASRLQSLPVRPGLAPMEAKLADELPTGPGWQFEPKWDGFRCLAFKAKDEVDLRAKSGKPLGRYFPDVVEAIAALPPDQVVLDGELVIPVGERLSFEALQLRLHPAESRVRRLAAESPATMVLFDCLLAPGGSALLDQPLSLRRTALELLYREFAPHPRVWLSPFTRTRARAEDWLYRGDGALDGVVAKRTEDPYRPGERAMLKIKQLRTADCVVGGFRYETGSRLVGSLLLGLYDEAGRLDHVGFTSTISDAERPALTRRLEALAGPPGFTGDAPGGPSRWSTERTGEWTPLRSELVVEVRYDHVTGGRFRHGTRLMRWRPDKAPGQCRKDQLAPELRPRLLLRELFHRS